MRIAPTRASDLSPIEAMLAEFGLPTLGVADQFPAAYVAAVRDDVVVGWAGLEIYGRVGLLRSLAVRRDARRRGVGRSLVEDRIATARTKCVESVYLLTTTADGYFARFGFVKVERNAVPAAVAGCPEFAVACPSSAACLLLRL